LTLCRESSLVNHRPEQTTAICLKCRSWTCEHCRPERRRQLMAQAASGEPNRFITLTTNPRVGEGPEQRLKALSHAWNVIVKRLRRQHPNKRCEYLAVVEATKRGEPHLHILYRGPFVPQKVLSFWMAELTEAKIVDIRKVKHQREVVRYVAKYITKKPAQFGASKRYWKSRAYVLEDTEDPFVREPISGTWSRVDISLDGLAAYMLENGYTNVTLTDDRLTGIPPPYEGKYQRE